DALSNMTANTLSLMGTCGITEMRRSYPILTDGFNGFYPILTDGFNDAFSVWGGGAVRSLVLRRFRSKKQTAKNGGLF
ncbi:MAG: hypothetical protein U0946_01540, partial [Patescibacteria group bacterium]|nr:hypothetical protein [Patescibacteria group bacterium]